MQAENVAAVVGKGLHLDVVVNGVSADALVDTGATVSLLSEKIVRKWSEENQAMVTATDIKVQLADGKSCPVAGEVEAELQLAGNCVKHRFIVASLGSDVLLGLDFMKNEQCVIDITNRCLEWGGIMLPLRETADRQQTCRVTVLETVVVPPGTEMLVAGSLECSGITVSCGIVEASETLANRSNVMVAPMVVSTDTDAIPLRLLNPGEERVVLYKGTTAATFNVIEAIGPSLTTEDSPLEQAGAVRTAVQGENETLECSNNSTVPEHLQDLYERSSKLLSQQESHQLKGLLVKFPDQFAKHEGDLGRTDLARHRIETGNAAPIKQRPRRLPIHQKEVADTEIESMLKRGIITPATGPWAAPVVLVRKKNGKVRFCVDYRRLNAITRKDAYPLPRIDETIDMLSGSRFFSTFDLASGYWQVPMDPDHKEKTAFATPSGLYQFEVMPFGLCNAPSTFERLMDRVLQGLQWQMCLVYLDDIIVYSRSFQEHMERLELILTRIREAGLKLQPKKCQLFQTEVSYLGHIVSADGVRTDPAKIQRVKDWPVLTSVREVRSFLGLASYYRRFVPGFAELARPLHKLTEAGRPFHWSEECERAFEDLKARLVSSPILAYPSAVDQFILDTDASDFGIGAVLSQQQDGAERVVAYASRSLTKAERNYCVTRKEMLAVVHFVRYFRPYLYGRRFKLRTDHGALKWLFGFRDPVGQVARWLQLLAEFDFEIEHRPGRCHTNADAMSRIPCNQCHYADSSEDEIKAQVPAMESTGTTQDCVVKTRETGLASAEASCQAVSARQANWVEGVTRTEIRERQRKDPVLGKVIHWLEAAGVRPVWDEVSSEGTALKTLWGAWKQLHLRDGVLYRRWEDDTGSEVRYLLVVPSAMQGEVLHQLHNSPTGGHLGITKLYEKARSRFYWPKMRGSVRDWARECLECAKQKAPSKTPVAPLKQQIFGVPLERVAIDITGPFPVSTAGNRYIIVITDYFTKWTEAYPVASVNAEVVADVLVNQFISRFGTPRLLHSDQGRQFESELFQETCRLLGIDKTRTTPYHPQSDGQVERFNRTLKVMLSSYTSENQRDWDLHVPAIMMAYRASPHESTGTSPNFMMFGREVELPIDVICGSVLPGESVAAPDYVADLAQRLEMAHEMARKHLKKAASYQRRHYDHKVTNEDYSVGAAVMMRVHARRVGVSPKLQPKFDGPYLITKVLSDVVVRVQKGPRHKPKVVHTNLLKPFHGEVDHSWFNRETNSTSAEPMQESDESLLMSDQDVQESHNEKTDTEEGTVEASPDEGGNDDSTRQSRSDSPDSPGPSASVTEPPSDQGQASPPSANSNDQPVSVKRRRRPPDRFGDWCL